MPKDSRDPENTAMDDKRQMTYLEAIREGLQQMMRRMRTSSSSGKISQSMEGHSG